MYNDECLLFFRIPWYLYEVLRKYICIIHSSVVSELGPGKSHWLPMDKCALVPRDATRSDDCEVLLTNNSYHKIFKEDRFSCDQNFGEHIISSTSSITPLALKLFGQPYHRSLS